MCVFFLFFFFGCAISLNVFSLQSWLWFDLYMENACKIEMLLAKILITQTDHFILLDNTPNLPERVLIDNSQMF